MSDQLLSLNNVSSGYKNRQIIFDTTIKVDNQEIVAILGRNGAGKSTLFFNIMGLEKIWSGTITLNNIPITNKKTNFINNQGISYMIQGARIFPELTIFENIVLHYKNKLITKDNVYHEVKNLLQDRFPKIWHVVNNKILSRLNYVAGGLSGGERQLLCLIRTVLTKNEVFLLDEPTIGISPALMNELADLIRYVAEKYKCAILLIEQKIIWTLTLCNRVYIMQRGEVTYNGSPIPILKDKKLLSRYMGII